ncbi:MAG: GAF domain-containing sensor histidine kinase [Anaerolineae bacterium]|nr:GAF domain-containing sensor histidine kinase [Anaerolineae bacterium]
MRDTWVVSTREIEAIVQTLRRGKCCRFIGPRYHRKSVIMRRACKRVDEQLGYVALYVSLRDARTDTEKAFYVSLCDLMMLQARRHYRQSLPRYAIHSAADLQRFLASLPTLWRNHVVLFVDDLELEVVPPDYIGELLRVLRGAFQDSRERRFLAVVCASHNLAWAALGPTSPFFNISDSVLLFDLSPDDTAQWVRQQLSALDCPSPTLRALNYLYEQTAGDRWILNEICWEISRWFDPHHDHHVTVPVVKRAIENLLRRCTQSALIDSIHELESDPQLLNALLLLMKHSELPASQLPLDLSREPDPLLISGFVMRRDSRYQIKSDLHYRILERVLTPERVGRLFLAAGDYERAMTFLRGNARAVDEIEERSQVMLSFISAMYTTATKDAAWQQLVKGLHTTYPQQTFHLYDYDRQRQNLVLIHSSDSASIRVPIKARHRPEIKAFATSAEYYWAASDDQHRTLFIPLRANGENLGLVVVENLLTRRNFQRRQGQVRELLTYLQYAARALKNREEFERLHRQTEQRARDLEYLLKLTRELMQTHAPFKQVLQQTLRIALKALRGRAQMGSIYLYDSQTGELTIAADTGYPPQVRQVARFKPGEGLTGYVYATQRPYIVKDTATDSHYRDLSEWGVNVRSAIGIPLSARQRHLGVLCVDNVKRTEAFDEDSERLMMIFANHVGLWLERVRLMEQLRHKRDTARLATDLVHEIKGTVGSIPNLLKEIESVLQPDQCSSLSQCLNNLRDIAADTSNVSNWLDRFAKTWSLQLETIDLNTLVAQVCQKMETRCPTHIQIQRFSAPISHLTIQCDRALIEILLENLIENAFEAIPVSQQGCVTLTVESDREYGMIRVWNNGPTIPLEHREAIWNLGWTTKRGTPLRGWGLSLCRYIAQVHKGSLVLDSATTEGVAFILRLPLQRPGWLEETEDETRETYFTR